MNGAVAVINASHCNSEEKKYLRILVRSGKKLPASFAGAPDFQEILADFGPSSPGFIYLFIILLL